MRKRIFSSDRLKTLMKQHGFDQGRLALEIGASQPTVSRYESGEAVPNACNLFKIAKALGVSMEHFFEKESSDVHETAPTYRARLTAAEIEQVKKKIDAAVAEGFEKLQKRIG